MSIEQTIFTASVFLVIIELTRRAINYFISIFQKRTNKSYIGSPFFEFLSGFFESYTHPTLDINPDKIPDKPCLFLMNHLDASDPLFMLKVLSLQKTPRKLIYVATTEFNYIPPLKKLLIAQECILVTPLEVPKGLTSKQCKMSEQELELSNLSQQQKQIIREYQTEKQKVMHKITTDSIDRLKKGHNVLIFPSGTFDHYSHSASMVRTIKPGTAQTILYALEQNIEQIDAHVVILKKLGIPSWAGGSFLWSIPYMLMGGSYKVTISLEAAFPLTAFNIPNIMQAENPVKIINAIYASFMSTEYLESPSAKTKLPIKQIKLNPKEQNIVAEFNANLEAKGYCGQSVKNQSLIKTKNQSIEKKGVASYRAMLQANPYFIIKSEKA